MRRDARYCSKRCRQSAWRFEQAFRGPGRRVDGGRPRRFAYADPPYPGLSERYYADHPDFAGEVDHRELVDRLVAEYPDGWALSTSSRSLRDVLILCPPGVRLGAWTKPAPPGYTVRPRAAWEPVVFFGGRPLPDEGQVLDWVYAPPLRRYPRQVVGTKPPGFCAWVFRSLGARAGDDLDDLFPGSGAVCRAWERYVAQDLRDASQRDPRDTSRVDDEEMRLPGLEATRRVAPAS